MHWLILCRKKEITEKTGKWRHSSEYRRKCSRRFALRVETLTPSERMVLQYYVDGYTIQEIASLLYISIGTARKHNTNMNRKLGITVREELMLYIELFRKCDQLDKLTYNRTE